MWDEKRTFHPHYDVLCNLHTSCIKGSFRHVLYVCLTCRRSYVMLDKNQILCRPLLIFYPKLDICIYVKCEHHRPVSLRAVCFENTIAGFFSLFTVVVSFKLRKLLQEINFQTMIAMLLIFKLTRLYNTFQANYYNDKLKKINHSSCMLQTIITWTSGPSSSLSDDDDPWHFLKHGICTMHNKWQCHWHF